MFDFRLKVFHTVAQRMSFTKAAQELCISQPAVTKHIKEIEVHYATRLFERRGLQIHLTESGKILYQYAEKIRAIYRDMDFEMAKMNNLLKGKLIIGASTTLVQYLLPELLGKFHYLSPEVRLELITGNTQQIENLLFKGKIDLGLIEGASQSPLFNYTPFKTDEIVLMGKTTHPLAGKTLSLIDLYKVEMVMREEGSGTQEFIQQNLSSRGIELHNLNITMRLGSSESIKSYLQHSDSLAFLSVYTALQELKNNTLTIIDIKDFSIQRQFHSILPKGEQAPVLSSFLQFLHHNK